MTKIFTIAALVLALGVAGCQKKKEVLVRKDATVVTLTLESLDARVLSLEASRAAARAAAARAAKAVRAQ